MKWKAPPLSEYIESTRTALTALLSIEEQIRTSATEVAHHLADGKKILIAGNGGSMSQAMHFAGELIGRYRAERRPYACLCLATDASVVTCIQNDYGQDALFSRQVEGLGNPGDVLIVLSTSGNSRNVNEALKTARSKGMLTVGWLGRDGGESRALCDHPLIVPGQNTAHIQEAHLVLLHYYVEVIESVLEG